MTSEPVNADNRYRLLHTMLRVRDLKRSLDFYTRLLGMQVFEQGDYPEGRFSLAFVGFGKEITSATLELVHNWDEKEPLDPGTGFGHFAIGVPDVYAMCERLGAEGVPIPRPPGPNMYKGRPTIAVIQDPDGYQIELLHSIDELIETKRLYIPDYGYVGV